MKTAKRNGKQLGMRIIKVIILIVIACSLSVLSLPIQGVAAKGPPEKENIVPETVYLSEHSSVYCYGGLVRDKEAAITAIENYLSANLAPTEEVQTRGGSYRYRLDDYGWTYYGDGLVWSSFLTIVDLNLPAGWATRVTVDHGSSLTFWDGYIPQYFPDMMALQDSWTWTGVGISFSFPPGIGFSLSGTTVTWGPLTAEGNWYMRHYFSGLEGSGFLIKFSEASQGSHLFLGTDWVSAHSSDYMWV